MMLDITSAPTTSACSCAPVATIWLAVVSEIGERRTRGAHIEAPGVRRADLVLNQTGGTRKHHVGRHRADDDHADVLRRQSRALDGHHGGFLAEIGGRHTLVDDVALADADPLHDPLVGRLDHLLEVGVRQHARRHVGRQRRIVVGRRADAFAAPTCCRSPSGSASPQS